MSNPYQALFEAVRTRIVDAAGPFASTNVIRWWPDEAADEVAPSERLITELCQDRPQALISYAGGEDRNDIGGGNEFAKNCIVRVRFGVRGPGDDYEKALFATGTGGYWGVLEVLNWIERRLVGHQLTGAFDQLLYRSDAVIPTGAVGKMAHMLTFAAPYALVGGD